MEVAHSFEGAISIQKREATRMLRPLILAFRRRHAVSTMIGGLIILTLILTALGTMVFVSQQYDQYQQTLNQMGQYESQQFSEKLTINSPGLTIVTPRTISGWGSGCGSPGQLYNCYNMSLSNLGGVGVQIARIYINSTGSGCIYNPSTNYEQPCILNPTSKIAPYAFNQANQFINTGEVNHGVLLALPIAVTLPDPTPASPRNTIVIVTSRGNVFSFQWPVPLQVYGQSQSAFSAGIMKVAYTGTYDSKNEPGPIAAKSGGTGGGASKGYCHTEPVGTGVGYAEALGSASNKIPGLPTSDNGVLWFVNPWITSTILNSITSTDTGNAATTLYVYVIVINTGQAAYIPAAGSIDLFWWSANHLDGNFIGVYYKGTFYPAATRKALHRVRVTTQYTKLQLITPITLPLSRKPQPCSGVTRQSRTG